MSVPYFYEQAIQSLGDNSIFTLSELTSKHCIQVLRMKHGDALKITDGMGNLFKAKIAEPDKKNCTVVIYEKQESIKRKSNISIGISLLKNTNRLEWFLEKTTEIGITSIIPLICKRTEKNQFRYDRMNQILVAAMIQSEQTWLPLLHDLTPIDTIFNTPIRYSTKIIAHCMESDKKPITNIQLGDSTLIIIGPEGDFTPIELEKAIKKEFQPVSLGDTRLRTETAGIVAATLLVNRVNHF